ncbi:hypothetical protein ACIGXM_28230 [Kitasatospora sp. NPDC052896]|uniref:Rv1733c family protein n=1 Tax=Kitasatospora sp. NPDC052896 TaxID=3364061 RepID=UPI0037C6D5A3
MFRSDRTGRGAGGSRRGWPVRARTRARLRQLGWAVGLGGPLCRPLDRARSRAALLALLGVAAAAALAVLVAVDGIRTAPAAAATRAGRLQRVAALVLGDAPGGPTADQGGPVGHWATGERVVVRWTDPAGRPGSARVTLRDPVDAGTTVPLWLTGAGRLTAPPPSSDELAVRAVGLGLAVLVLPSLVMLVGHAFRQRALDRRAGELWGAEWAEVAPRWSGPAHGRPGTAAP